MASLSCRYVWEMHVVICPTFFPEYQPHLSLLLQMRFYHSVDVSLVVPTQLACALDREPEVLLLCAARCLGPEESIKGYKDEVHSPMHGAAWPNVD